MIRGRAAGPIDPGLVLRRAVIGWGLGHAALGRPRVAAALLAAELLGLTLVGALVATLVDTTWYLVPFIAGSAFLVVWAGQAVLAYRAAREAGAATAPSEAGSPATVAAWLAVPLLLWGTAFWLVAATAATPAAVLDRFVTLWPESGADVAWADIGSQPERLATEAADALARLDDRCRAGELDTDCGEASANLLRGVRIRVVADDGTRAVAVAQLVRYERRPARFLGLEIGTELVPVPVAHVIDFDLEAHPAPVGGLELGARRWTIVNAHAP